MADLKLYMILLGCKPPGRHVEQHDFFFGIATSLNDLMPQIKDFWPGPQTIHIDAWREVNNVDGFKVAILPKQQGDIAAIAVENKLFFINLGGYREGMFEEQHYTLLTAKADRSTAFNEAKQTLFYKENHFGAAVSHIDDKYGIDVDDIYQIEDVLSPGQKSAYQIKLIPGENLAADKINLGYLKL